MRSERLSTFPDRWQVGAEPLQPRENSASWPKTIPQGEVADGTTLHALYLHHRCKLLGEPSTETSPWDLLDLAVLLSQ